MEIVVSADHSKSVDSTFVADLVGRTLIFNEDTPKENDYLNFGHLCLVEGKFEEAISYYYNAYSALGNDINKFVEKWQNDIPSLKLAGMKELDADLLLDAIMIKIKE